MNSLLDGPSRAASSCDEPGGMMNPLVKGNSCAMPPVGPWWAKSWNDAPAGPTNPLAGEVAAVAGGPFGEAQYPFVADGVPPVVMTPGN